MRGKAVPWVKREKGEEEGNIGEEEKEDRREAGRTAGKVGKHRVKKKTCLLKHTTVSLCFEDQGPPHHVHGRGQGLSPTVQATDGLVQPRPTGTSQENRLRPPWRHSHTQGQGGIHTPSPQLCSSDAHRGAAPATPCPHTAQISLLPILASTTKQNHGLHGATSVPSTK